MPIVFVYENNLVSDLCWSSLLFSRVSDVWRVRLPARCSRRSSSARSVPSPHRSSARNPRMPLAAKQTHHTGHEGGPAHSRGNPAPRMQSKYHKALSGGFELVQLLVRQRGALGVGLRQRVDAVLWIVRYRDELGIQQLLQSMKECVEIKVPQQQIVCKVKKHFPFFFIKCIYFYLICSTTPKRLIFPNPSFANLRWLVDLI